MIQHDFTLDIQAPVAKVFAYTTDFNNFVQWQEGVSAASQSPAGPTRAGTTFTLTRTFLGRKIDAAGAVTEFEPNRRCVFRTTSGPIQLSVALGYQEIANGTRLTVHLEAQPGGVFKLAEGAMDRQLEGMFDAQVKKLKTILEQ